MKVLAKPELENSVILNEFVLIMENFGIPTLSDEEEYENDYIADTDDENEGKKDENKEEDDKTQTTVGGDQSKEDDKAPEGEVEAKTEKHAKMMDLKSKTDKK